MSEADRDRTDRDDAAPAAEVARREGEVPHPPRYQPPRLLSVETLEEIAAACAPVNPGGPGKSFPTGCGSAGS
jgi:hypothetical protein